MIRYVAESDDPSKWQVSAVARVSGTNVWHSVKHRLEWCGMEWNQLAGKISSTY